MNVMLDRKEFMAGMAAFALAPAFAGDREVITPLMLDVRRKSKADGPGTRTAFCVKGCPLRCVGCNVPESFETKSRIVRFRELCDRVKTGKCPVGHCTGVEETCPSKALKLYGRQKTMEDLISLAMEDKALFKRTGGGVTLSGGEPLMFVEWSVEFLRRCKAAGLHTCLDTSLYGPPEAIESLMPVVDLWLPDYKAHDDNLHRKLTGFSNETIRRNLRRLVEAKAKLEVRCLAVPGYTDGADLKARHAYLESLGIAKRRIVNVKYRDDARAKYIALGMADTMPRQQR